MACTHVWSLAAAVPRTHGFSKAMRRDGMRIIERVVIDAIRSVR